MESLLRSDPRLLSSRQQMFTNYDNVIQDLFNQMRIHSETERHLQEMLRQHSERITAVERKLVLVNTSGGSSGEKLLLLNENVSKLDILVNEKKTTETAWLIV